MPPYSSCFLNVTEPPRFVNSQQNLMDAVEPIGCCCCSQGTSQTTVTFTNNIARSGDALLVNVQNDNRSCKQPILGTKISLVNNVFMQSKSGRSQRKKLLLNEKMINGLVPSGGVSNVQATIEVPPNLASSTVIGYAVANYYTVEVASTMQPWCCSTSEGAEVSQHVYLRALNPVMELPPPQ